MVAATWRLVFGGLCQAKSLGKSSRLSRPSRRHRRRRLGSRSLRRGSELLDGLAVRSAEQAYTEESIKAQYDRDVKTAKEGLRMPEGNFAYTGGMLAKGRPGGRIFKQAAHDGQT